MVKKLCRVCVACVAGCVCFRRILNVFVEMFVFAGVGQEICHTYVVISENTL